MPCRTYPTKVFQETGEGIPKSPPPRHNSLKQMEEKAVFRKGNVVLHSPCTVGSAAFTPTEAGNKFCSQCNKTVHNLVGKTDAEIKALFAAHGGQLCGTIRVSRPVEKPAIRYIAPPQKPSYFKQLAATASLLLLAQWSMAAQPKGKAATTYVTQFDADPQSHSGADTIPHTSENTIVTAVVMNQANLPIPLDFEVFIYSNQVLVAQTTAHNGLFKCDLAGKVQPGDTVVIAIPANNGCTPDTKEKQEHGAAKMVVLLRSAQNLQLVMDYKFPILDIQMEGGMRYVEDVIETIPERPFTIFFDDLFRNF